MSFAANQSKSEGYMNKEQKTGQLVLVRHGQSVFNAENKFAGWVDTPLTDLGKEQAELTGEKLRKDGFVPDVVFTSDLSRAIDTGKIVLAKMGLPGMHMIQREEVRERHYGGATGWDKAETKAKLGEDGLLTLRRSFDVPPPVMDKDHPYHPQNPADVPKVIDMPENGTESLKDVVERVKPFWEKEILPRLQKGENIMIAAHGNSLRALTMIVEKMTPDEVKKFEMENAVPVKLEIESAPGTKEWTFKKRSIVTGEGQAQSV